jgi:hypothetical protein
MIGVRRRKAARSGIERSVRREYPSHLKWLRGCECAVAGKAGHICLGKIEAAHIRRGTSGGTSLKPADYHAVPLCSSAHAEQHTIGEQSFDAKYSVNLNALADALAKASPHRWRWEEGR